MCTLHLYYITVRVKYKVFLHAQYVLKINTYIVKFESIHIKSIWNVFVRLLFDTFHGIHSHTKYFINTFLDAILLCTYCMIVFNYILLTYAQ